MTPCFLLSDEKFENLCMHAEGLMDSSNRKEKGGDLPQALLHCNRAIGRKQPHLPNVIVILPPLQIHFPLNYAFWKHGLGRMHN